MDYVTVEYLILIRKVLFFNEGTFNPISSVQEEGDIFKWNDLYGHGKALVYYRIKILYDRFLVSELA